MNNAGGGRTAASGILWVPAAAAAAVTEEADRWAPLETGGMLLGYWSATRDAAVVEFVVGPGPEATHRAGGFVPDHHYQDQELGRLYRAAGRNLDYLGDWHTHPEGPAALSHTDLATLRRIAQHAAARAPRPIMLLLAGGEPWHMAAWMGEVTRRWWWRDEVVPRPMEVHVEAPVDPQP